MRKERLSRLDKNSLYGVEFSWFRVIYEGERNDVVLMLKVLKKYYARLSIYLKRPLDKTDPHMGHSWGANSSYKSISKVITYMSMFEEYLKETDGPVHKPSEHWFSSESYNYRSNGQLLTPVPYSRQKSLRLQTELGKVRRTINFLRGCRQEQLREDPGSKLTPEKVEEYLHKDQVFYNISTKVLEIPLKYQTAHRPRLLPQDERIIMCSYKQIRLETLEFPNLDYTQRGVE